MNSMSLAAIKYTKVGTSGGQLTELDPHWSATLQTVDQIRLEDELKLGDHALHISPVRGEGTPATPGSGSDLGGYDNVAGTDTDHGTGEHHRPSPGMTQEPPTSAPHPLRRVSCRTGMGQLTMSNSPAPTSQHRSSRRVCTLLPAR